MGQKEPFRKRKKYKFCVDFTKTFSYNSTCVGQKAQPAKQDASEYGALVKRSRRRPLTAESRVRFPDALPRLRNPQNIGNSKVLRIFLCKK